MTKKGIILLLFAAIILAQERPCLLDFPDVGQLYSIDRPVFDLSSISDGANLKYQLKQTEGVVAKLSHTFNALTDSKTEDLKLCTAATTIDHLTHLMLCDKGLLVKIEIEESASQLSTKISKEDHSEVKEATYCRSITLLAESSLVVVTCWDVTEKKYTHMVVDTFTMSRQSMFSFDQIEDPNDEYSIYASLKKTGDSSVHYIYLVDHQNGLIYPVTYDTTSQLFKADGILSVKSKTIQELVYQQESKLQAIIDLSEKKYLVVAHPTNGSMAVQRCDKNGKTMVCSSEINVLYFDPISSSPNVEFQKSIVSPVYQGFNGSQVDITIISNNQFASFQIFASLSLDYSEIVQYGDFESTGLKSVSQVSVFDDKLAVRGFDDNDKPLLVINRFKSDANEVLSLAQLFGSSNQPLYRTNPQTHVEEIAIINEGTFKRFSVGKPLLSIIPKKGESFIKVEVECESSQNPQKTTKTLELNIIGDVTESAKLEELPKVSFLSDQLIGKVPMSNKLISGDGPLLELAISGLKVPETYADFADYIPNFNHQKDKMQHPTGIKHIGNKAFVIYNDNSYQGIQCEFGKETVCTTQFYGSYKFQDGVYYKGYYYLLSIDTESKSTLNIASVRADNFFFEGNYSFKDEGVKFARLTISSRPETPLAVLALVESSSSDIKLMSTLIDEKRTVGLDLVQRARLSSNVDYKDMLVGDRGETVFLYHITPADKTLVTNIKVGILNPSATLSDLETTVVSEKHATLGLCYFGRRLLILNSEDAEIFTLGDDLNEGREFRIYWPFKDIGLTSILSYHCDQQNGLLQVISMNHGVGGDVKYLLVNYRVKKGIQNEDRIISTALLKSKGGLIASSVVDQQAYSLISSFEGEYFGFKSQLKEPFIEVQPKSLGGDKTQTIDLEYTAKFAAYSENQKELRRKQQIEIISKDKRIHFTSKTPKKKVFKQEEPINLEELYSWSGPVGKFYLAEPVQNVTLIDRLEGSSEFDSIKTIFHRASFGKNTVFGFADKNCWLIYKGQQRKTDNNRYTLMANPIGNGTSFGMLAYKKTFSGVKSMEMAVIRQRSESAWTVLKYGFKEVAYGKMVFFETVTDRVMYVGYNNITTSLEVGVLRVETASLELINLEYIWEKEALTDYEAVVSLDSKYLFLISVNPSDDLNFFRLYRINSEGKISHVNAAQGRLIPLVPSAHIVQSLKCTPQAGDDMAFLCFITTHTAYNYLVRYVVRPENKDDRMIVASVVKTFFNRPNAAVLKISMNEESVVVTWNNLDKTGVITSRIVDIFKLDGDSNQDPYRIFSNEDLGVDNKNLQLLEGDHYLGDDGKLGYGFNIGYSAGETPISIRSYAKKGLELTFSGKVKISNIALKSKSSDSSFEVRLDTLVEDPEIPDPEPKPQPKPEPTPTAPSSSNFKIIMIISLALIVVGIIALFIWWKSKQSTEEREIEDEIREDLIGDSMADTTSLHDKQSKFAPL